MKFLNYITELPLLSLGFRGVMYPSSLDPIDENMFKSVAEAYYMVCILNALYIINYITFVTFNFTGSTISRKV